jgi:hypothetical protein
MFQNLSPATKLREAVQDGNEAARWGRMDIALEKVDRRYARQYALSHHDWGDGIQMADVDVESIQMAEDENVATVVVAFGWYDYDTMTLQRTVIRQKWSSVEAGGFVLTEEEIIDGNERLLEPPPEPEEDEEAASDESEEEVASEDSEWVEEEGALARAE